MAPGVDQGAGNYRVSYGSFSREFPLTGQAAASGGVVIHGLLPNPPGSDVQGEEVTLRNKGPSPVVITGWRLEDRSGLTWPFSGSVSLSAGETRTIRRNGRAMSLNNGGDDIRLIDAAGTLVDRSEYQSSSEGVSITTGH